MSEQPVGNQSGGAIKSESAITWPVALGALVAAAGLAWAIVSHFLPRSESSAPTSNIETHGENSPVLHDIENSDIRLGAPPREPAPSQR